MFIIFVLIIIFASIFILNIPNIKGFLGESIVSRQLRKIENSGYKVLNNLLIETVKGSSQIDHVVISIFGIFVIETKNYSGWIHGNENSEYWTQTIYRYRSRFRNPIKQNFAHIYALRERLSKINDVTYYPIVVFTGSAELKNVYSSIPVIYVHELIQTILRIKKAPSLSIAQVEIITNILSNINIKDKVLRKKHLNQVQQKSYKRKQMERLRICPNCGGRLLVRNGPYGKFYGCSNYPKCNYTLN